MNRIEINPKKMLGKPVIKDTRITVELILEELSGGRTAAEVVQGYPNLVVDDISAALLFAADALRGERVYPIAS